LKRIHPALLVLLFASLLISSVMAQGFPIALSFGTAVPMPIGQAATVTVTVKDIGNSTVQLIFVGIRFEWSGPNTFFIGGNSEKGAVLAAGQQLTYDIAAQIPNNVTPGAHRLSGYATYRVFQAGNWSGTQAGWWVSDIQFAFPQAVQSQTTRIVAPQQTLSPETVAVIAIVLAIGLVLERGRIRRLLKKPRAKVAEPAKPETQEPEVRQEEDL
jgi:hypothetical protein